MDLQIKTGKKVYTLKDEYGNEIGKIAFNPGDQNFVARVKGFKDYLESEDGKVAEIDRLSNEGKVEEAIELMTKLDKNIKAKIDEIFDANVSDIVFGNACCLSKLEDGSIFVESFLTSILPEYKKMMSKSNEKVQQYTRGYINDRSASHKHRRKRK